MSDLVEHVHFAVSNVACIHKGEAVNGKCADCDRITRAAIAAVAEWLEGEGRDIAAAQLRAAAGGGDK